MPYFSRLTDIVTCRLSEILERESDPLAILPEIIREMEEGVHGAQRSVKTSGENVARLEGEIAEQRASMIRWKDQAREALAAGQEDQARLALIRKREVANLIAGLEQQLVSAMATQTHLTTMLHALEARLADARRRLSELGPPEPRTHATDPTDHDWTEEVAPKAMADVESELEALRSELKSSADPATEG